VLQLRGGSKLSEISFVSASVQRHVNQRRKQQHAGKNSRVVAFFPAQELAKRHNLGNEMIQQPAAQFLNQPICA
jgi:hypothetical protein